MTTLRVFDPAMCCSTGVCGPSVDPRLVRFSADLDWLQSQGVDVRRSNLAQQPADFAAEPLVRALLEEHGEEALPAILVGSVVVSFGLYPSRAELATWAGVAWSGQSIFTDSVAELVAIGAAVGSGCEPCFKFHYDKARKLGVSRDDMRLAVDLAQSVKETPARAMRELTDRYLSPSRPEESTIEPAVTPPADDAASACCAPAPGAAPAAAGSGRCC